MKKQKKIDTNISDKEEELRLKAIALEAVKRSYEAAKNELAETKQILETIVNGITDGILLISKDYKILWANKAILKETGCLPEEIINKHCYEVTHQRTSICTPPHDICPIREMLRTGKPKVVTHTHFDSQQNKRYVEVVAYPVRDKTGQVSEFIHIERDVTERKNMEEALRDWEASCHSILNSIEIAIIIHDINSFEMIEANRYAGDLFLLSPEKLKGTALTDIASGQKPYTGKALTALFEKASQNEPQLFEWKVKDKAGNSFFVEARLKRALVHGSYHIVNVMKHIGKK